MSAPPTPASPPPTAPPSSTSSSPAMFGSCWSCRLLSGSALILSAGYVYQAARRTMRQGGPTSMGTVAQIVFASGLAAWGMVVIMDPVGKATKKTKDP
ncbi:distal membrane-arm assembly complex protein 1 [Pygocentrus nattereri]|uniref:Distal membrane-arm assembly complex protein 1-like domain-containing protein n=1 Tax=Pygocentrus nattereri TaxID=42514 RepID=A0A3B4EK95_PYGNA|nr:distal membrane-arm assembly complex protein 1 [Pygocentrus nattereri]XP_037403507.1 distal membrane-arm assembly complex protein 1 [Pygocentrus nattereri]